MHEKEYMEKEVQDILDEYFVMSDDEKLYYAEKQQFEEKTNSIMNRYIAKSNDKIHPNWRKKKEF